MNKHLANTWLKLLENKGIYSPFANSYLPITYFLRIN